MDKKIFPKHTESFWHKTSHVDKYPKLEKDLTVDVAVIGGGIAGILAAYELSSRGKSVALLEARKFLYGTTGFTTAKLNAQHDVIYDSLIKRYGKEKARDYFDANIEGVHFIRDIAKKHSIKCELKEDDAYIYTQSESIAKDLEKESKAYKTLSIDGGLVEELPINIDIEAGLIMRNQYEFHPVMFLSGVLKELEKMNVSVFEHTMVTEVVDGDEVTLKTKDGNTVSCKQAICASHYPVDDPDKFYAENMEARNSLATVYEYNNKYPGGMYISSDIPSRTIRLVDANEKKYILVGGEGHTLGDGTSDLERYKSIVASAEEIFGVKDVVARWSSHDYMTKDRMPFIGLSGPDRKNIFVVTGLNKWGLSNSAISSKILADAIEGKENSYKELFNPNREIPDIEEPERDESKQKRSRSTSKDKAEDLNKEEALVYEEDDTKFAIFKDSDGKLHHLDLTCTHLGCDLGWNDGDKTWDCPCHGSRFNALGEVIEGPAMEPLKKMDENKKD